MDKKLIRLTESDLHRIVKESVNAILINEKKDEFSILDKIERMIPGTRMYKMRKNAEEIRARREREEEEYKKRKQREAEQERIRQQNAARRQPVQRQQQQQQPKRDIYSQTIRALNNNDYSFFDGREELQGVLASLYNSNSITYRQYDKGLEWIGRGYKYPSGQSDGLY